MTLQPWEHIRVVFIVVVFVAVTHSLYVRESSRLVLFVGTQSLYIRVSSWLVLFVVTECDTATVRACPRLTAGKEVVHYWQGGSTIVHYWQGGGGSGFLSSARL